MKPKNDVLYLAGRLQAALALDERTNILDTIVNVTRGSVVLSGRVASESQRMAVEQVIRELVLEPMQVINALHVAQYEPPNEVEPLP